MVIFGFEDWLKEMLIGLIERTIISISNSNIILSDILKNNAQQYSGSAFNLVMNIAESVVLPIAGVLFTYVIVNELIQMHVAQNNMHEYTGMDIFKWIFKTFIGILLISNSFTISNALIEVGAELVISVTPLVNTHINSMNFQASAELMGLEVYELIPIAGSLLITNLANRLGILLVNLFIISRFFEIYMYLMVSPVPFATLTSDKLNQSGLNYIKNIIALAIQGLVILVSFAIYTAISATMTMNVITVGNAASFGGGILEGLVLVLVLVVMVWRSRSVSQSIVGSY